MLHFVSCVLRGIGSMITSQNTTGLNPVENGGKHHDIWRKNKKSEKRGRIISGAVG